MTKFFKIANSPWRMRFFLLWKLPAAWFMGISLRSCDSERAVVRLPYRWRSQNPFRSTYFAAQCAAGEFSTGILALAHLQGKPPVSMLVTRVEAEFFKKASETLLFTCEDGRALEATIRETLETGEPQVFRATSLGKLPDGTEAARVWITWSFKRKIASN
ncbi:MAG: hypothetical protein OHK0019_09660 [Saprospiraceae bacterium]